MGSETAINNQKFSSRDGEPVNKPRKVEHLFSYLKRENLNIFEKKN